MEMIKVFITEDESIVREGLRGFWREGYTVFFLASTIF